MDEIVSLGYWIRRRRKSLDLTQDELARRVGCAVVTLRKIEADERHPSKEIAARLADALELNSGERVEFLQVARAERWAGDLASPSTNVPRLLPSKRAFISPASLPLQSTPFIGREREVTLVGQLLLRTDVRLLTLTGAAGIGKTRLGLEVAGRMQSHFSDGCWFVSLAAISDPAVVAQTIAQPLGVKETAGQPLQQSLQAHLRDKQVLLVLDNFEHLLTAAPLVADLLAGASRLTVLVTSREVLHLYGEHELAVPPLSLPPLLTPADRSYRSPSPVDATKLVHYEALQLFIGRAQAAKADYVLTAVDAPAVAEICHRLDGLPLAIELAAARVKLLPPSTLLARLEPRLQLLTGGARNLPTRQQTLRSAIDWSYDLLIADEQQLFAGLAVFVGGSSLEAAEQVIGAGTWSVEYGTPDDWQLAPDNDTLQSRPMLDVLQSLVDKSLLYQEDASLSRGIGEPRFAMLETIHEYAWERLQLRGEAETLRQRHAAYYLALVERAEPALVGAGLGTWVPYLEAEHANLRAALTWALQQGDVETAARLAGGLWRFWEVGGYLSEGRRWLETVLAPGDARLGAVPNVLAKVLQGAGALANDQGDYSVAHLRLSESLTIRRELGDRRGIAYTLNSLGLAAAFQGDYVAARALHSEGLALCRALDDKLGIAVTLNNLGIIATEEGDYAAGRALHEESLALRRAVGDKLGVAGSLTNLGNIAMHQGEAAEARALHTESLPLFTEVGDRQGIALAIHNLGDIALMEGDIAQARARYAESLPRFVELGDRFCIVYALEGFAAVAAIEGKSILGLHLAGAAAALRESIGAPLLAAEQASLDGHLATARLALGTEASGRALAEGRAMTLEQAIDYALDEDDETTR